MALRPIVLLGGEPTEPGDDSPSAAGLRFDGRTGVWRDADGRLGIQASVPATTRSTRTREGVDQSERAAASTRITKTMEGTDQVETGR